MIIDSECVFLGVIFIGSGLHAAVIVAAATT